jgi:hypothetical protein
MVPGLHAFSATQPNKLFSCHGTIVELHGAISKLLGCFVTLARNNHDVTRSRLGDR